MNLIVFGATGGTGARLVERGLAAGHTVTAFARRPAAITLRHDRLKVSQGDVLQPDSVAAAMQGQHAALSALGPPAGSKPGTLISTGTTNILSAMQQHGVKRLIFESGLMVGDAHGMALPKRLLIALFRRLNHALYVDKVLAERLVRESGLDWTIVRPPNLKHVPARGGWRVGEDLDIDLLSGLSHADVADFMVQALADASRVGKVLDISY